MMLRMPTCLTLALVLALTVLFCAPVLAGEKIKSVSADQKQFVITNQDGKDVALNLADNARIILPEGKEGSAKDLKAGQVVSFLWEEKGGKYIATAVMENSGTLKDASLAKVTIKNVGAGGTDFVATDSTNKEWTFQMGDKAKVSVDRKDAKLSDLKAGNTAIIVFEKKGPKLNALSIYSEGK